MNLLVLNCSKCYVVVSKVLSWRIIGKTGFILETGGGEVFFRKEEELRIGGCEGFIYVKSRGRGEF